MSIDKKVIAVSGATGQQGACLVNIFWQPGTDELGQANAAVHAAKTAAVRHFIWSTLPNVKRISHGKAGQGQYLPLVGDFLSFYEMVATLNRQGHTFSFKRTTNEFFAGSLPGAAEIAATLPTSKHIRTWVLNRKSRFRSQTRSPADSQPDSQLGRE